MRKFVGFVLGVFLLLSSLSVSVSALGISSRCGVLMEQQTGRVMYEKCADEPMYIASITKILTALIAIEETDLDVWVEIDEEIIQQVGSSLYLIAGDEMKLSDLLYGLMLRSGNDAALAIARHVGGSEADFATMMNERAAEIGMENSMFQNASGLDETTYNLSTARDMALLQRYAMNHPIFREISGTVQHRATSRGGKVFVWRNKHRMVRGSYEYAVSGKTGYTEEARRTLVTSARQDDMELVVVTIKAGDDWNDHRRLFEYGFANYETRRIVQVGELDIAMDIADALPSGWRLFVRDEINVFVRTDGSEDVKVNLAIAGDVLREQVGFLQVLVDETVFDEVPVYKLDTTFHRRLEIAPAFSRFLGWFRGEYEHLLSN